MATARNEILREVSGRIAEAEMRSSTLATEAAALARAGGDAAEVLESLYRDLDDLEQLRRHHAALELQRPRFEHSGRDRR
ncbi:hypothetical protein ADL19_05650 [Streptomyces purpurogeneiscleroticus]|nr:hypothetical protein ADL19_05650 [Streptomyces purpurogeneiscleroticus]